MDKAKWASIVKSAKQEEPSEIESLNMPNSVLGLSNWPEGKLVEPSNYQIELIEDIKRFHPEVCEWSQMAIWDSWGWYSQDCLLVSSSECEGRHDWYLGYLHKIFLGESVSRWNGDTEKASSGYKELLKISRSYNI